MMLPAVDTPEQQRKTLIDALLFDGLEPDYIVEEVLLATTERNPLGARADSDHRRRANAIARAIDGQDG